MSLRLDPPLLIEAHDPVGLQLEVGTVKRRSDAHSVDWLDPGELHNEVPETNP